METKNEYPSFSQREYDVAEARRSIGATLTWRDVSVYASNPSQKSACRQLINNVRGVAKPGDLTAILGVSGAGKSSLMMALAFRTGPGYLGHGDVRVNGVPVDSSYMMRHSGYMHQEDLFVETLTVLEHLWFMARMKLDTRTKASEIRAKVERLLRDVGLIGKRDTRIGGTGDDDKALSGGEKKRLAFATELLTDPEILFLDEPTTGQDSHSASVLIARLTSFAAKGRTVLCTIHQPSSAIFDSFDQIVLITSGRVAFAGSADRAVKFFASQGYQCPRNFNPADFLLATLVSNTGEQQDDRLSRKICDSFLASEDCREIDYLIETTYRLAHSFASFSFDPRHTLLETSDFKEPWCYARLFWLVHRGFLQILRDPSVQVFRMLQKASVAWIAGLCFMGAISLNQLGVQATQGVIFILVSENAFFPMYSTLALIPQELPLIRREYRAGMYPIHLYYAARMLSLIPGLLVEPLLFTTILYWLAGLRHTAQAFALSVLVLVFTMNVSAACGCFFSAAFDSVPLAMAYLVPFDYVLMITMGPFVKLRSLPIYIRWVKYASWLLHSSEALTILQWQGVESISCERAEPDFPCITNGTEVLERYDFDGANFWPDILLMFAIYALFHVLGCALLWNRCRYH